MKYYIFCSCLFIFAWLFISFFFLKSGWQNDYSLGINLDKIVISFFVNFKPPHQTDIENKKTMIDPEKEVVIYFWYYKPCLNAFSGI